MLERVKRAMIPRGASASVTVGKTQSSGEFQPPVGKIGRMSEKSTMRKTASTKLGTLTPMVATRDRQVVPRAILVHGGEHAERHAPRDGEDQGHAAEQERDRQRLGQDLAHRARLVHEGLPEVPADGLADEDRELLPQRLVEPVDLGEVLLGVRREGIGAFGDGIEGAAGRCVHHEERDERHGEQRRNQPQEAIRGETEQCTPLLSPSRRWLGHYRQWPGGSQGGSGILSPE